jgi:ribosome-binding protein aMBF1 (putative translation factor)
VTKDTHDDTEKMTQRNRSMTMADNTLPRDYDDIINNYLAEAGRASAEFADALRGQTEIIRGLIDGVRNGDPAVLTALGDLGDLGDLRDPGDRKAAGAAEKRWPGDGNPPVPGSGGSVARRMPGIFD